jgi:hypothetical protein
MVSEQALIGLWAFFRSFVKPGHQASLQCVKGAGCRRAERLAHIVGAILQVGARVGQRVHRRESAGHEFRRQITGIASTHADEMVSVAARPNSAWH